MIPLLQGFSTIILADGSFPKHQIPVSCLKKSERIIVCDGATKSLLKIGIEPDYIVGDLDSLSESLKKKYVKYLRYNPDQEINDLTKAVHFSVENGWNELSILGATGKREDHTLGNISLLTEYMNIAKIQMITDFGVFVPMSCSTIFESFPRQQISLFSLTPETKFTIKGLKYPLDGRSLSSWWQGTLNEADGNSFEVQIDKGKVIVFRAF